MSLSDLEVKYHTQRGETEHTIIALLAAYKEKMYEATEFIQKQNQESIQFQQKIRDLKEKYEPKPKEDPKPKGEPVAVPMKESSDKPKIETKA